MILVIDSTLKHDREKAMDILEAIRTRRSIRVFKPNHVPKKVLQELLDISRWAPSGGNVQPRYSDVLTGQLLARVTARLVEKARTRDGKEYANTRPDLPRTGPYSEPLIPEQQSLKALQDAIRYPLGTRNVEAKAT